MQKAQLADLLNEKHNSLAQWLQAHPSEKWTVGPAGKWTTGQHIVHLIQSTKPLLLALSLPALILRFRFGKANRPSRDYATVVARYHERLAKSTGVVSPFSQKMPIPQPAEKAKLMTEMAALNEKVNKKMSRFSEAQLDRLLVPHPLMGKMTLREILMWNAYHTEHHHNILEEKH